MEFKVTFFYLEYPMHLAHTLFSLTFSISYCLGCVAAPVTAEEVDQLVY